MPAQIRDLLNGLTPRQRITLVAVALSLLAGLGLLASHHNDSSEEAILSGKAFSPEELDQARMTFHQLGLSRFRVVEQQIYAPRDDVASYNAALIDQSNQPRRFGASWNQALDRNSLLPPTERERQERLDLVRAEDVVNMIKATPQIADARLPPPAAKPRGAFSEARRTAVLSVTPNKGVELSDENYRSFQRIVASLWNMADTDVVVFNTRTGQTYHSDGTLNVASFDVAPVVKPGAAGRSTGESALVLPPAIEAATSVALDGPKTRPASKKRSKATKPRAAADPQITEHAATAGVIGLSLISIIVSVRIRRRSNRSKGAVATDSMMPAAELATPSPQADQFPEVPPTTTIEQPIGGTPNPVRSVNAAATSGDALPATSPEESNHASTPAEELPAIDTPAPLRFLNETRPEVVLSFVSDEHPQAIALILSQLSPELAEKVLRGLPSTKRLDVGRRVATLEETNPEIIQEIASSIRNRVSSAIAESSEEATGAEWLQRPGHAISARFESNDEEDPALADRMRRLMFVFDDLLKLDESAVAPLIARVDISKWALALKGASEELKSKILENLAPATAEHLWQELNDLGPVRLSDVAAAQQQIVALIRRLEDSGELVIDAGQDVSRTLA